MDIGKELRIIDVEDPAPGPIEIERLPVEETIEEPADTGPTTA